MEKSDLKSDLKIHAEISIIPIKSGTSASMSREVALAFHAIRKINNVKTVLTPMGTVIEANNFSLILAAIEAAHKAVISSGVLRVITTVRIDQRLDKAATLEGKTESVKKQLR